MYTLRDTEREREREATFLCTKLVTEGAKLVTGGCKTGHFTVTGGKPPLTLVTLYDVTQNFVTVGGSRVMIDFVGRPAFLRTLIGGNNETTFRKRDQ
eukprot:scaffold2288_cov131-Skeletonema_menzelii.AAC.2